MRPGPKQGPRRPRILVVEDDPSIRLGLGETLRSERYEVSERASGDGAVEQVLRERPDLVLLDVMLPGVSGYDVCRELRARGVTTPVIMVTAKGQELDRVVGLKLGADDYVTKPFGVQELLARVEAVLRRSGGPLRDGGGGGRPSPPPLPDAIEFGAVRVDTRALRGTSGAAAFVLTPRELRLLGELWREAGKAVARQDLLDRVWGEGYLGTTRTLDQVVLKLRQKLEADPANPRHILTVHGLGYRLEA